MLPVPVLPVVLGGPVLRQVHKNLSDVSQAKSFMNDPQMQVHRMQYNHKTESVYLLKVKYCLC